MAKINEDQTKLVNLIEQTIEKRAKEYEEDLLEKWKKSGSNYMVQYCPCGHFREILNGETELLQRAKANKCIDALTLHSTHCPECKENG